MDNFFALAAKIRAEDEEREEQRKQAEPDPKNYRGHDLSEAVVLLNKAIDQRDHIDTNSRNMTYEDVELQCAETNKDIRKAGYLVHSALGSVEEMVLFVKTYVRRDRIRDVDFNWSGIGDWVA